MSVLTLGVFDTFHYGHVNRLIDAAKLGPLHVGIQDAQATKIYKGRTPRHTNDERQAYVSSLRCVTSTSIYDNHVLPEGPFAFFIHSSDISPITLGRVRDAYPGITCISKDRTVGVSSSGIRAKETTMRIAVDYHDTLTYNIPFFRHIFHSLNPEDIFIVTGTPPSRAEIVIQELKDIGFDPTKYNRIIFGFEYSHSSMNENHFERMAVHKLQELKKADVNVYFDDNPYYVNAVRDHITAFMPCMSTRYMKGFVTDAPFLTCNLQEGIFDKFRTFEDRAKDFWIERAKSGSPNTSHVTALNPSHVVEERWRLEEAHLHKIMKDIPAKKIYEPGCGHGHFTRVLTDYAPVIASDLAEEFVEEAKKLAPVAQYEIESALTATCKYDCDTIFFGGLMVYLDDKSVHEVLSAGYKHVIMAESYFDSDLEINKFSEKIGSVYYSRYRSLEWWHNMFEKHGYSQKYEFTKPAVMANASHRLFCYYTNDQIE